MPEQGNKYIVELKNSHLNWGTHRYTSTRSDISGEGYVPIPKQYAEEYGIYRGECFTAVFSDGFKSFSAKAAGNSYAGSIYAKQFQGNGDLKAFGRWFAFCGAKIGDRVSVTFLSKNCVEFQLLSNNSVRVAPAQIIQNRVQIEEDPIEVELDKLPVEDLIGKSVCHALYGAGIINSIKKSTQKYHFVAGIRFANDQKFFDVPASFNRGQLDAEDENAILIIDSVKRIIRRT